MCNAKRDLHLVGYTILKSDVINKIDRIYISGIEPKSVILSQPKYCKKKILNVMLK